MPPDRSTPQLTRVSLWLTRHGVLLATLAAAALLVFLSTYHLTESPPIWTDEGHLTQVAMNTAVYGLQTQLQVAPGVFESGAFSETSGYPVLFPVAAAFYTFGVHLLSARSVMVIFILLFALCVWQLAKREMPLLLATYALWLIVSFAPLYGNGKNVLGEVPGLFYLTAFLLCLTVIEKGEQSWMHYIGAGLFVGLAVSTKPIFLVALLPVAVVALFSPKMLLPLKTLAALGAFLAATGVWIWVQFGNQTIAHVIDFYANPFAVDTVATISSNAFLFISAPQPFYALVLLVLWTLSIPMRIRKRIPISRAEYTAFGFAVLIYLAFLRITPYYRYYFVGEIFALFYLPLALWHVWPRRIPKVLFHAGIALLIAFQIYQCFFSSWVAGYYRSHRTAEVSQTLGALPISASIFIYNAPELPLFLPAGMPYYQYLFLTPIVIIGKNELPLIAQGVPDFVIVKGDSTSRLDLSSYRIVREFDQYSLWQKKSLQRPATPH